MWRTPDGRAHTVALPDPTTAMTPDFVESLRALGPDARIALAALLDEAQEEFFDLFHDVDPTEAAPPHEDGLPGAFLQGTFGSAKDIARYLNDIDVQWKLDALLAVEDYLSAVDSSETGSWIRKLLGRFTS
jgi:hypothetical protein